MAVKKIEVKTPESDTISIRLNTKILNKLDDYIVKHNEESLTSVDRSKVTRQALIEYLDK